MTINTAANATFSIGTTADIDEASEASALTDFQDDTYVDVGEVEDVGDFGDSYNTVTFNALTNARIRKMKGSADSGELTLVVAFDSNDEGQEDMQDALKDSNNNYNFRVVLDDAITTGSGAGGTELYFYGKVMSFVVQPGGAESVIRASVRIALDSTVYQQDAT